MKVLLNNHERDFMNQNRFFRFNFISILLFSLLMGCTKSADTYKEFVQGGEIYYPGRADSLKSDSLKLYPGRNRIQLSWLLKSDPKITKTTVYWNSKADSIVISVSRSAGTDTIRTMINQIAEGTYTFEVYTYDDKGNKSVKVDAIGNVYGSNYDISLVNRALKSASMSSKLDTAKLEWYPKSLGHVGVDLRFKNLLGDSISVFVPADSLKTNLLVFKKGDTFKFRSLYKPEQNAIDTFYTAFESRIVN